MSNNEASNDSAKTGKDAPVSRQSMKRSRRTQASQPKNTRLKAGQPAPAAASDAPQPTVEQTHALVVSSRRKRYTDNRPVDPSPIAVAQTVRMAGNRPIQASPGISAEAHPNLNDSPQIMNRPIASNTSPDEEELLGYLD